MSMNDSQPNATQPDTQAADDTTTAPVNSTDASTVDQIPSQPQDPLPSQPHDPHDQSANSQSQYPQSQYPHNQYPHNQYPHNPYAPYAYPQAPNSPAQNSPYAPYPQYSPYPQYASYAAYPPVDPVKIHRRALRKAVGRPAGLTLAYQGVITLASFIVGAVLGVYYMLALPSHLNGATADELSSVINEASLDIAKLTGVISLACSITGFLFMLLMRRRDILSKRFWAGDPGHARMKPAWLLVFIVLIIGAQAAFLLLNFAFSAIGVDLASPTSEQINEASTTVTMWLYVGLIGPIVEEVVFRGVLMKELKPLGKNFAILTSAIMFALYHDDVIQGLFAFSVGLVLGFVAMEYSLFWSITLHVFNNAVLGGLGSLADANGDVAATIYVVAVLVAGIIGVSVVMFRHGWGLSVFRRINRSAPGTYWGWTSGCFITFCSINGLVALVSFIGAMAIS
ncbi:metal-dependent membrane protease [Bifidobacterium goeldii]|uniref:Metal-dependent membrane protease n=1 Tax=Bifidobacterium goeldii TaxID=2306975 RepID=A0A430FKW6_9BIFI|nr:metal-dependent membrane protease [Bifidobacterium goeldii]